jgi:general secretion pathway protein J
LQRGFTLVELLVVMTLLALLMTGLVSAMRTMAQTETKIDHRLQRMDDLRTTHAFLRQTLSRVSGARIDQPGVTGKSMVPFAATPNSVSWVGTLPARPGVGGRHYFRLAVEGQNDVQALVLRVAPCGPDLTPPDWTSTEAHLLMRGVSQLLVQAQGLPPRYLMGGNTWPQGWQSGWPISDELPDQIHLSLQDEAQVELMAWTFTLHPYTQSDPSISSVTVGGSAR